MGSRVEAAQRGSQVLRTQLAGSTSRFTSRGEPDEVAARGIIAAFFGHRGDILAQAGATRYQGRARSRRASPTRIVTPLWSKWSSSAIANLRDAPSRSR